MADKLHERAHRLYNVALLTRCYTQHVLRPYIESDIHKATSSLFPVKMITKLKGHKVMHTKQRPTQNPHKQWEVHKTKFLGFLRRDLAFAPMSAKEVAYKTLVRPKLEYAAPFWSPYCATPLQQMEKVQRPIAHWICKGLAQH